MLCESEVYTMTHRSKVDSIGQKFDVTILNSIGALDLVIKPTDNFVVD